MGAGRSVVVSTVASCPRPGSARPDAGAISEISHFVAAAPAAIRPRIYCAYCNRALSEAEAGEARDHHMTAREIVKWACGCLRRYQDGEGGENLD